jgi:hypothetical protein
VSLLEPALALGRLVTFVSSVHAARHAAALGSLSEDLGQTHDRHRTRCD